MAFKLATSSKNLGWNTFGSNSFSSSTFGQNTQKNPEWKKISSESNKRKSKKKKSSGVKVPKECKTCRGKGYYICALCDGSGIKKIEYMIEDTKPGEWNIKWEKRYETCSKCKGKGVGITCHICKGTGVV